MAGVGEKKNGQESGSRAEKRVIHVAHVLSSL